jgi:hypothetical protein
MRKDMNDYNQRQLARMLELLCNYEHGAGTLRRTIDDIDALLECLESPDSSWKSDFRRAWSILEECYAVALDQGQDEPRINDSRVKGAVRTLRALIETDKRVKPPEIDEG